VGRIISKNSFPVLCANSDENDNGRVVTLDWRKMRRMFAANFVHITWRDDLSLPAVVSIVWRVV